jgi:hypothetical protein
MKALSDTGIFSGAGSELSRGDTPLAAPADGQKCGGSLTRKIFDPLNLFAAADLIKNKGTQLEKGISI